MNILNEVDKPGSDIDSYVTSLDKLLADKQNKIIQIRKKLYLLHTKLKDEEALSGKLASIEENKPFDEKSFDVSGIDFQNFNNKKFSINQIDERFDFN